MENNQNPQPEPVTQPSNPSVITPSSASELQPAEPIPQVLPVQSTTQPQTTDPSLTAETYTVGNIPAADQQAQVVEPATRPKRKFKLPKTALIAVAVALVLLGGSAAAYLGYVVPNKPQNILAKSLSNSLSEHKLTTTGILNLTSSGLSSKIEYTLAADEDNHATDTKLDATISGVSIPFEVMTAKGNAYFKVGDLSSLESIINSFVGTSDPSLKQTEDKVNASVSNQWISIDSTLIKEAKLDCLMNYPASFSQSDINSLKASYKNSQFVKINSHTADTLNGKSAIKYELSIDDNTLAKYDVGNNVYFKNIQSCLNKGGLNTKLSLSSLKDSDTTPLTIWVDKSTKRIVKYAGHSTAKDKSANVSGDLSGTITYGNVSIDPPTNTKPLLSVIANAGLSDLFGSLGAGGSSESTAAADTERQTDINVIRSQLEVYFAVNGYYPTLANLNDAAWRATNMKGFDSNALKDPAGTATNLASSPAAHVYSYVATPAGCDNVKVHCTGFTLSATLDSGGTYAKQALN